MLWELPQAEKFASAALCVPPRKTAIGPMRTQSMLTRMSGLEGIETRRSAKDAVRI